MSKNLSLCLCNFVDDVNSCQRHVNVIIAYLIRYQTRAVLRDVLKKMIWCRYVIPSSDDMISIIIFFSVSVCVLCFSYICCIGNGFRFMGSRCYSCVVVAVILSSSIMVVYFRMSLMIFFFSQICHWKFVIWMCSIYLYDNISSFFIRFFRVLTTCVIFVFHFMCCHYLRYFSIQNYMK